MTTTLHHATSFLLCDEAGDLQAGCEHGYYFDDVRCLSRLRLLLDGDPALALTAAQERGDACVHFCTNARTPRLPENKLGIRRKRSLGEGLTEELVIESYADEPARLEVRLVFGADFADLYQVKRRILAGAHAARELPEAEVEAEGSRATLQREIEGTRCTSELTFSRAPAWQDGAACFDVELVRGAPWTLTVHLGARIERPGASRSTAALAREPSGRRRQDLQAAGPKLESDHPVLAAAYTRAVRDLVELRIKAEEERDGEYAIAAGIPWYMALFGRDSLIAAYQAMLHDAALAKGTLTALAHLQGQRVDEASEEQPGRILHEYRKHGRKGTRGDLRKLPYYGSIDATPLWLITLSEYVRCTGDLEAARTLWPNVERALAWIDDYGDRDGDGLVEYEAPPGGMLQNEGWKDSDDAVRFADGRRGRPPIALVEVQGYVVDAWMRVAELGEALGRRELGAWLRGRAAELRRAIEGRFWLDQRRCFAEALDGDKRPVDALTSNPGQLLWSRAVSAERARAVAAALLGDELFSGWGVRTMGAREGGYDPVSYHNGSVWPHDNALFLQGLSRYGFVDAVGRLADTLLAVLQAHPERRFPELFAGFGRDEAARPVAYPNANEPQAWASGAVPLLVRAVVGLEVNALARRVRLRPAPLAHATYLRLRDVAIGGARATIDVRFDGEPRAVITGLPSDWRTE